MEPDSLGLLCMVINTSMLCAPLEQIGRAVAEKNARFIDANIMLIAFVNSCTWTAFGVVSGIPYVIIPNGIGAFAGVV
jgi:solute carrier family 50 protein (sugar transporter)